MGHRCSEVRGALGRFFPFFHSFREQRRRYSTGQRGRFHRCIPLRLGDAEIWTNPGCNGFPPKRVQNVASDLLGVEALSWSWSPPQRSLVSQL
jgi:hypothetical protein